ncbi:MAG: hypothetical protein KAU14_03730, partial [Thermoplasmata archaeon]|nr:hypothetical protein [Thermoplasmata archaeon]
NIGEFRQDPIVNVTLPETGENQQFTPRLDPSGASTHTGTFTLPDILDPGMHLINLSVKQNSTAYHEFQYSIPSPVLQLYLENTTFELDDGLELMLRNDGGVDTDYSLNIDTFDPHYTRYYRTTENGTILAGDNLTFSYAIFDQALSGDYFMLLWARDSRNGDVVQMSRTLVIDGLEAVIEAVTNQTIYYIADGISIGINLTNLGKEIVNGTLRLEMFSSDLQMEEGESPWYSTLHRYRLPLMINTTGMNMTDIEIVASLNFTDVLNSIGVYDKAFDEDSIILVEYDSIGRIRWPVSVDIQTGSPLDIDLFFDTYSPKPRMLYLVGGRTDYDLDTRVGAWVDSVTRVRHDSAEASTIMDSLRDYDIIIYDGMQSMSEFDMNLAGT